MLTANYKARKLFYINFNHNKDKIDQKTDKQGLNLLLSRPLPKIQSSEGEKNAIFERKLRCSFFLTFF